MICTWCDTGYHWRCIAEACSCHGTGAHSPQTELDSLRSERDKLLSLLGKERDEFGKKEIELMRERDRLREEVQAYQSDLRSEMAGTAKLEAENAKLQKENSWLKAWRVCARKWWKENTLLQKRAGELEAVIKRFVVVWRDHETYSVAEAYKVIDELEALSGETNQGVGEGK